MLSYILTLLSILTVAVAAPLSEVVERQDRMGSTVVGRICLAKNPNYCIVANRGQGVKLAPRDKSPQLTAIGYEMGQGRQMWIFGFNDNFELLSVGDVYNGAWAWINSPAFYWEWKGQQLQVLGTNYCLDLKDGDHSEGARIQIWTCSNNDNQRWRTG